LCCNIISETRHSEKTNFNTNKYNTGQWRSKRWQVGACAPGRRPWGGISTLFSGI